MTTPQHIIDDLRERLARLEAKHTRKRIYNQSETAARLNMSVNKLRDLHARGLGPQRLRQNGGRVWQYTDEAIEAYIAEQAKNAA
jgi:hypothetical protein